MEICISGTVRARRRATATGERNEWTGRLGLLHLTLPASSALTPSPIVHPSPRRRPTPPPPTRPSRPRIAADELTHDQSRSNDPHPRIDDRPRPRFSLTHRHPAPTRNLVDDRAPHRISDRLFDLPTLLKRSPQLLLKPPRRPRMARGISSLLTSTAPHGTASAEVTIGHVYVLSSSCFSHTVLCHCMLLSQGRDLCFPLRGCDQRI